MVCNCGSIPTHPIHSQYPHSNGVHHGHGAVSYQNVQVQHHHSVPIPNNLQVDDGESFNHIEHDVLIAKGKNK